MVVSAYAQVKPGVSLRLIPVEVYPYEWSVWLLVDVTAIATSTSTQLARGNKTTAPSFGSPVCASQAYSVYAAYTFRA